MGLFDKQKCVMCGKEGRLLDGYPSVYGVKYLCDDCEYKMHVSGYTLVGVDYDTKPSFEALQNYQKFYCETTNMLKEKRGESFCSAYNLDDIILNEDVICFPEYTNFMISTDDVFAVTYTDLPKYSGVFTDAFMITIFTTNPTMPYYSFIVAGRASFFSLTCKAKKFREATFTLFELCFKNLKYPVDKARRVRKMVKNDTEYDLPIYKEKLMDWLDKAEYSKGKFNPKKAERKISKVNWATEYFKSCGYRVV